jgi:hypothetical protein
VYEAIVEALLGSAEPAIRWKVRHPHWLAN